MHGGGGLRANILAVRLISKSKEERRMKEVRNTIRRRGRIQGRGKNIRRVETITRRERFIILQ